MQKIKKGIKQKQMHWNTVMVMIVVIISLSGCTNDKEKNDNALDAQEDGTSIYLIAMDESASNDALDVEVIGCNDKLVEVKMHRKLSSQEALETLFTYTDYKKEDGLYNVFSLSPNLQIENMIVANNFATVTLSKDLVTGGMCDDPRVSAQIRKTLMQFDEIDGVDIFIGEEEVTSYLSEKDNYDNMEFSKEDVE